MYFPTGVTTPTRVYGQGGSFFSATTNYPAGLPTNGGFNGGFSGPGSLALDANDGLYVTDKFNSRVLYFSTGSTLASRVYGQFGSFTTNTLANGGVSADSLAQPDSVILDRSGNLYVTDRFDHRVLFYTPGSTTATRVYGQNGSFSLSHSNGIVFVASPASLSNPSGMALDAGGSLYVTDLSNNRVVRFDPAPPMITSAPLTVTLTAAGKTYDGTTTEPNANLTCTVAGVLAVDGGNVTCTATSGTFDNAIVGSRTVTATVTISGSASGNYTLGGAGTSASSTTKTATASITGQAVTAVITASNKTYNGNANATVTSCTLTGVVSGDTTGCAASATAANNQFDSASVGTGKTVTATGITLTNNASGNYTLTSATATTTANVTTAAVTATLTAANKTYDGTTTEPNASMSCTLTGVVAGDTANVTCAATAGTFNLATAGSRTVTATATISGTAAGNYTLGAAGSSSSSTSATASATISAKSLTATITADNKTYDGTTSATIHPVLGAGVVGSDTVTVSGTGTFATKTAGLAKTVTSSDLALGGADAGNYTLSAATATTTADVTAKSLTASITADGKTYDGTTLATIHAALGAGVLAPDAVTVSGSGTFDTKNVGTAKTVTSSNLALSGTDAGNYTLSAATATTTADVTAKSLTASITADNKTYDGTTTATIHAALGAGVLAPDAVTVSGSGTFDTKNVGTAKTVTSSNLALSGADVGNYTLASVTATTTADITAKSLTASITADNKTYDGTTSATIHPVLGAGVVGSDTVTVSGTGTFATKTAGLAKTVTSSNLSLGGADAGNYALSAATATTTADITAKSLTASITADNKTYDGTTTATIHAALGAGVLAPDVVTLTGSGTFDTKNVGTAKTVTSSNLALSGADAGNYTLSAATATTTADVTAKSLTASITADSKTYDGTTLATIHAVLGTGILAPDVVTVSGSGTFATKTAGLAKAVTSSDLALSGTDAGNYTLSAATATTTADITTKSLAASITADNKTYDGTTTATIHPVLGAGVVGSDTVTVSGTGTFATKTAGLAKTVTSSNLSLGGADAGNYTLASVTATTTADITAKSLTASITADSKTYDGTTSATIHPVLGAGVLAPDVVTLTGSGTFATKNVGTAKTVTSSNLALSGADAGNYTLSAATATTTADVTAKSLTASITADGKTYDGTTSATIHAALGTGVIAPDAVTLTGSGTFDTKNVGTAKAVTSSNLALSGADVGNYALASAIATTTADVTAKGLTASITADSKTYDGTTAATIHAALGAGVLAPDAVTVSGSGTFDTKNAGTAKTVTSSNLALSGADVGNYTLASAIATTTADVTTKSLAASITADGKIYDGTTLATIHAALGAGVLTPDVVTLTGSGTFATKNAGTAKTVTSSNLALTGADAGNYALASAIATTTADVTAKSLAVSITADNKTYDGTTTATIHAALGAGVLAPDVVTLTGSGTFATKNVGTAKTVTSSNLALSGADVGNYTLASVTATTTADITAKSLTASITADSKTYDGTTTATIHAALGAGVLAPDVVTLTGSGTFDTKNAGTAKTVTSSNLVLTGADAGNYALASATATTTADVTAKSLTASITADSKTYDGTTLATIHAVLGTGILAPDVVTVSGSGTFATKTAGLAKAVTSSDLALSGTDAGNYTLSAATATTTADVTAKSLTASITADNKTYDGTTSATIHAALGAGVLAPDVVTVTGSGTFDTPTAGPAKTVTANDLALGGIDAGNYWLGATATTTAAITTAASAVTVSCPATPQTYSGAALQVCTASYAGVGGLTGALPPTYTSNVGVGTASASASYAGDANHDGSSSSGSFTIVKALLTVSANNKTRADIAPNPLFDGTITGAAAADGITASFTAPATTAPGTYPIVASLVDPAGRLGNYTVTIHNGTLTVFDTQPPVVTVPSGITIEASSGAGAVVVFDTAVSALDTASGPAPVTCVPASSSTFAIGSTLVTCAAHDAAGNTGAATFTVLVQDKTAPMLSAPDLTVIATDPAGKIVTYAPLGEDAVSGELASVCSPTSGTLFTIGSHPVTCGAADAAGNIATVTFQVNVLDGVAPVVIVPVVTPKEATSAAGAAVSFIVTATDNIDQVITPACTPTSGAVFALGTTTVRCTTTDAAGNSASASFGVTVRDTTRPVLTTPSVVTATLTSGTTQAVSYTATAVDVVSGTLTPSCSPASGSAFPIGSTTVQCTVTDGAGNTALGSFAVKVNDGIPPVVTIAPTGNRTIEATSASGAVVTFTATATDNYATGLTPICAPASGSTFPLGSTNVTCQAYDLEGNVGHASFTVTVVDTTAPVLTLPATMPVTAPTNAGVAVSFTALAQDSVDGSRAVTCVPASGSTFLAGNTTVNCSTSDSRGNTRTGSFVVAVTVTQNAIGKFVAFSQDRTLLRAGATVTTGDVGANERRRHVHPDENDDTDDGDKDDVTVRVGVNVNMQQTSSRVVGDTVRLLNRSSIYNLVNNFLINKRGTILGTQTSPMTPIPYLTMPSFPVVTPGTLGKEVAKNATLTLAAGSYGTVHVAQGGTLILTGGLYQMRSLDVDQSATVLFRAATEIRIKTELDTNAKARLILDQTVPGLGASKIQIFVEGSDASCSHLDADDDDDNGPTAVHIGQSNIIQANIYAPNGTVWLRSKTQATGAFIARHVRIGVNVKLTLDSAFR